MLNWPDIVQQYLLICAMVMQQKPVFKRIEVRFIKSVATKATLLKHALSQAALMLCIKAGLYHREIGYVFPMDPVKCSGCMEKVKMLVKGLES